MKSIKEIFEGKNFSEEALIYLENAINEFVELYGKYVSRDELIKRIEINIDAIEFVDEIDSEGDCSYLGTYNINEKKIRVLASLDEEQKKSVFFHEFLHAEASDGRNTGFHRYYKHTLFDDTEIGAGRGWNEGFVQMMTRESDKKIAGKVIAKGYPILTAAVEKFSELFGKEELIAMYHNNPDKFIEFFNKKTEEIYGDENDFYFDGGESFLEEFDVIHMFEKEAYARKNLSKEGRLLRNIFRESSTDQKSYDKSLLYAQEHIIKAYRDMLLDKEIETISDLDKIMTNIIEMYEIISKDVSIATLERIIEKTNPQILDSREELSEDNRMLIESYLKYKEFTEADKRKKIEMIQNTDDGILNQLQEVLQYEHDSLEMEYYSSIISILYENSYDCSNEDPESILHMMSNLSKYIIDNNLSFENLRIVYNCYSEKESYELFYFQEDGSYEKIATLVYDYEESKIQECKDIDDEKKRKLCENYPQIVDVIAECENGDCIVYDENGNQSLVSIEYGKLEKPIETVSIDSINGLKIKQIDESIKHHREKLRELQKVQAPDILIQKRIEAINKKEQEKKGILDSIKKRPRNSITPSQIEIKTTSVVTSSSLLGTVDDLLADLGKENKGIKDDNIRE